MIVDNDERMERKDCLVVPVSSREMDLVLRQKQYFFPRGYLREVSWIYFYETAPLSQIRFFSKIKSRIDDGEGLISFRDKALTFKDPSKNASVFTLEDVQQLPRGISKGSGQGIQSRIYVTKKNLSSATVVTDFFRK